MTCHQGILQGSWGHPSAAPVWVELSCVPQEVLPGPEVWQGDLDVPKGSCAGQGTIPCGDHRGLGLGWEGKMGQEEQGSVPTRLK